MAALAAAWLAAGPTFAASEPVPAAINYQGKLTDNLGNAVRSGYYEIQFRIWNDPTKSDSANYIWGRKFPLHVVTNGMFNVLLTNDGEVPGSPSVTSILDAFAGTDRYLGLTITRNPDGAVGTPVEITPRQKLATGLELVALARRFGDHLGLQREAHVGSRCRRCSTAPSKRSRLRRPSTR